jgi:hypothetical protein
MKRCCFIVLLLISCTVSASDHWKQKADDPDFLHRAIKQVTDVIVHDIFSPPVASRIYAYITIAGYEASIHNDAGFVSLAGQLHGLRPVPQPDVGKAYSYSLAAVHAVLLLGKTFVISEKSIEDFHNRLLAEYRTTGMPRSVYLNSLAYGKVVADHVLAWSQKDNYKETRSFDKYALSDETGRWKPTPPAYMRAIEPHWNKIRPFVIDSASQFKPAPPVSFSTDKESRFYKEALEVVEATRKLSAEQIEMANFWDCNPFKMNVRGHVMFATKKISPGGHWINITRLASRKAKADFIRTAEAYAVLSIALADGFISCWDEKYRSNTIRPETYINQYISAGWMPLLQTPPFPEYTSGHSVISTASAVVLTKLFGDGFSFADSTEIEFGLPERVFPSFKAAAEEAAISRFYGGIHYQTSIKNGVEEGKNIGEFIAQRLRTRKEKLK